MIDTNRLFLDAFPAHPCPGSVLRMSLGVGVEAVAKVEHDPDARPEDNGCYTPEMIDAWRKDRWSFVAVTLWIQPWSDTEGFYIDGLYGIGIGLAEGSEDGDYLTEVANNLLHQQRGLIGPMLRDRARRLRKAADGWDEFWRKQ